MSTSWQPPGGGRWQLENVHVQGWQPRVFQELAPEAFKLGLRRSAARYGVPIDYLDLRFVNDHCYARMRPLGAPEAEAGQGQQSATRNRHEGHGPSAPGPPTPSQGRTRRPLRAPVAGGSRSVDYPRSGDRARRRAGPTGRADRVIRR